MADITISDLELAPALADDMVFPVENTTDTYAATLAMLRRLINKTFVEMEDANFNDLTDDGFYQCTGTPTNSPEAGAINWTLQVSAESGVVVQRAFSLDDRFENFYIRRFNGVIWTAWKNMTNVVGTPFSLGDSRYFETAPYNASWLASNGQYNSSVIYPSMWGQLQVELSNISVGEVGTYNGYSYTKRGLPVVLSTDTIDDEDFVVNQNDQTFRLPLLNGEEDLPGNTFEDIAYNGHGSNYTATKNGTFYISGYGATTNLFLQRNSNKSGYIATGRAGANEVGFCSLDVKRGDTVQAGYYNGTVTKFGMSPAIGNGTLYYYVGDTVQDASLINAGAVLGQLSNKADIDASNFNASGKSLLSGLGMPSGRYIDLVLGASGVLYTAPANGYFNLAKVSGGIEFINGVNNNTSYYEQRTSVVANVTETVVIPARKGDIVAFSYNMTGTNIAFRFIYAEGEN